MLVILPDSALSVCYAPARVQQYTCAWGLQPRIDAVLRALLRALRAGFCAQLLTPGSDAGADAWAQAPRGVARAWVLVRNVLGPSTARDCCELVCNVASIMAIVLEVIMIQSA
jgi:hypothetical protein